QSWRRSVVVRDGRHTVLAQAHGGCEGRHGSSVTEQTVGSVQRPQEVRRVDNPCTQCDPKTLDSLVQYIPSCRRKGKLYDHSVCPYNQGLACCTWVSRSRRPATALTNRRPLDDCRAMVRWARMAHREHETRTWGCVA